ncbi:MAG TPA: serine protease, partial [Thermoanaerobaculia bacterium]|nr:serine protease [Thermoanaerobaculia bacterium]
AEPQEAAARAEVRQGSPASRQRSALWTGTFPGERVRVEYLAPRGASGDELPFRVDRLLHVYRDLVHEAWQAKEAGSCNNDVSCYGELAEVERAVALVLMPDRACTGTLIADLSHDGTPLFLTANHCVHSNADAADTELVWFYKSAACNGQVPSLSSLPHSLGTSLVSTSTVSDFTLLRVKGALPPNPTFAGWTSDMPEGGTESLTIHHPDGDFKRVSFGVVDPDARQCTRSFRGKKLVRIDWTDGPTEPGSSGAGIFRADTLQLFGQLLGGPSSCGHETYDCFGSFAATYPRIEPFLGAGADDAAEDNDNCAHARTVAPGTMDGLVAKANDDDWYRMRVPKGKKVTVHLDFVNADGDLELQGKTSCASGNVVTASLSTDDTEEISLEGGPRRFTTVYWRVSLQGDTRNEYTMRVTLD